MNDFKCTHPSRRRPLACLLATAAGLALAMAAFGPTAGAESIPACTATRCPADYMQLSVNEIGYAPGLLKLQARVSQAKIPVGDAVFDQITVNLIRPGAAQNRIACTETIPGVRVRNSVLNLDIGRQMANCELDQVVAQEQDLAFEICINSPDNCLKPIPLGSVPYALKANYSVVAQKAHTANESVQAHYAHRLTADTELFVGERTHEDGYLDFATPDGNEALSTSGWERISESLKTDMRSVYGADLETEQPSPVGGFIQWTPVSAAENLGDGSQAALGTLHLVAKDEETANKLLKPLARMMIHAEQTFATGELHVMPADGYVLRSTADGTAIDAGASQAELTATKFSVTRWPELIDLSDAGVFLRSSGAEVSVTDDVASMSATISATVSGGGSELQLDADGLLCQADAQFGAPDTESTLDVYSNTRFFGSVSIPAEGLNTTLPPDSVSSTQIENESITTADIKDSTIVTGDIQDGTIESWDINDDAIESKHIKDDAIVTGDIQDGTIESWDINDDAIESRHIKDDAIVTGDIQDGTIESWDINDDAIESRHIHYDAIEDSAIKTDAILSRHIRDDSIRSYDIKDETIDSMDIKTDAIWSRHIERGAIESWAIKSSAIRSVHIKNRSIDGQDIKDDTIQGRHLDIALTDYQLPSNDGRGYISLGIHNACFLTRVSLSGTSYRSCELQLLTGNTWRLHHTPNGATCRATCF